MKGPNDSLKKENSHSLHAPHRDFIPAGPPSLAISLARRSALSYNAWDIYLLLPLVLTSDTSRFSVVYKYHRRKCVAGARRRVA